MRTIRKTLCILTALMMMLLFAGSMSVNAEVEILPNGDFETLEIADEPTSGPKGFSYSSASTEMPISAWSNLFVTGNTEHGNYINLAYGDWILKTPYVPVNAGQEYIFSCQYNSVTDMRAIANYNFYSFDEETQEYTAASSGVSGYMATTGATWQEGAIRTTAVPEGASYLQITLRAYKSAGAGLGSEQLYFDNLRVTEATYDTIYNGSMETAGSNGMVDGWSILGGTAGTNAVVDSTVGFSGQHSLKLTNDNDADISVSQSIPLPLSKAVALYDFRVMTKIVGTAQVELSVHTTNPMSDTLVSKTVTSTGNVWDKVIALSASQAVSRSGLCVKLTLHGSGTVYFDSAELIKNENILPNPSFETYSASTKKPTGFANPAGATWLDILKTGALCPHGSAYVMINASDVSITQASTNTYYESLVPGTTYLASVWYKATDDNIASMRFINSGTGFASTDWLNLPSTGGAWGQFLFRMEVPAGSTPSGARLSLRTNTLETGDYVAFDYVSLVPDTTTLSLQNASGKEVYSIASGEITAKYHDAALTPVGATIIMALYDNTANGKVLLDISVGTKTAETRDVSTALTIETPGANNELSVMVWDSLAGMHSIHDAIAVRN